MGKALVYIGTSGGTNFFTNQFLGLGAGSVSSSATEARNQVPFGVAGTLRNFQVSINNLGTSRTARVRIGGVNGNLTVNPTNTTAGVYVDNAQSDVVSVGSLVGISETVTGASTIAYFLSASFTATTNHAWVMSSCGTGSSYNTANQTAYLPVCGNLTGNVGTAANTNITVNTASTLSYMSIYVSTNTRSQSIVLTSYVNGATGNQTFTVGSGLTGLFQDTTHTDTISAGQTLSIQGVTGSDASTSMTVSMAAMTAVNSSTAQNDILAYGTTGSLAATTTRYFPIIGGYLTGTSTTTEDTTTQMQHGFSGTMSLMRVAISASTTTGSLTFQLRKNSANGNQVITVGAGLTGYFQDATNSDTFLAADTFALQVSGGTSGNFTMRGLTIAEVPSPFVSAALRPVLQSVTRASYW